MATIAVRFALKLQGHDDTTVLVSVPKGRHKRIVVEALYKDVLSACRQREPRHNRELKPWRTVDIQFRDRNGVRRLTEGSTITLTYKGKVFWQDTVTLMTPDLRSV